MGHNVRNWTSSRGASEGRRWTRATTWSGCLRSAQVTRTHEPTGDLTDAVLTSLLARTACRTACPRFVVLHPAVELDEDAERSGHAKSSRNTFPSRVVATNMLGSGRAKTARSRRGARTDSRPRTHSRRGAPQHQLGPQTARPVSIPLLYRSRSCRADVRPDVEQVVHRDEGALRRSPTVQTSRAARVAEVTGHAEALHDVASASRAAMLTDARCAPARLPSRRVRWTSSRSSPHIGARWNGDAEMWETTTSVRLWCTRRGCARRADRRRPGLPHFRVDVRALSDRVHRLIGPGRVSLGRSIHSDQSRLRM